LSGVLFGGVRVNIFNISKINSEVRGGKAPRIKRLSDTSVKVTSIISPD
jgi:type III restriction enzyme